jgi:hypothetical protein
MLFKRDILDQIAAKRVTVAFRRWRKPSVKPGGTLTTPVGVLTIDALQKTALAKITDADLKRAGYPSRSALTKELAKHPGGDLYKVAFHLKGADPRIALRENGRITKAETKSVISALRSLDQASERGPWTTALLRLIDKYPARRAPDLAASQRRDPLAFKRDVRKLKELGLTEALEIGYRLSPRGRSILSAIESAEEERHAAAAAAKPAAPTFLPPRIIVARTFGPRSAEVRSAPRKEPV